MSELKPSENGHPPEQVEFDTIRPREVKIRAEGRLWGVMRTPSYDACCAWQDAKLEGASVKDGRLLTRPRLNQAHPVLLAGCVWRNVEPDADKPPRLEPLTVEEARALPDPVG